MTRKSPRRKGGLSSRPGQHDGTTRTTSTPPAILGTTPGGTQQEPRGSALGPLAGHSEASPREPALVEGTVAETAPAATPARAEDKPRLHPHTCGLFAVLDICEIAHRDVAGKPLCLGDADLREPILRDHLERCPVCQRWYRNARRAYERLAERGASPGAGGVLPRPRRLSRVKLVAGGSDVVLLESEPEPGAESLNSLAMLLDCRKDPRPGVGPAGKSRWWLTLKFMARGTEYTGNDEEELKLYDGLRVRLDFPGLGESEPLSVVTRLGLDPQRNLVSSPRALEVADPRTLEKVTLTPLGWVEGLDGA
jgi:hypothetical protein